MDPCEGSKTTSVTATDNPVYVPRLSENSSAVWWELADNKFNENAPVYSAEPKPEPEVDPRFQAFPMRRNLSEPKAWWEDSPEEAESKPARAPAPEIRFKSRNEMLGIQDSDDDEDSSAEPVTNAPQQLTSTLPGPQQSVSSSTETESSSSSESGSSVYQDVGTEESSDEDAEAPAAASAVEDLRFSLSMIKAEASEDEHRSSPAEESSSPGVLTSAVAVPAAGDFVFQPSQRDSGYGTTDRGSPERLNYVGTCQDIDALLATEGALVHETGSDPGRPDPEEAGEAGRWLGMPQEEEAAADGGLHTEEERLAAKRSLSLFISEFPAPVVKCCAFIFSYRFELLELFGMVPWPIRVRKCETRARKLYPKVLPISIKSENNWNI